MKKFIILYKGPARRPGASHEGWFTWFGNLGSALLDKGSKLSDGTDVRGDGSYGDVIGTTLNGYSIIQAKDMDAAIKLVESHPYLQLGKEYTVQIFRQG